MLSTDVGHRDIVTPSTLPYAWRVKGFVRFTDSPSVVTQVGATGRDVTSMSVPGRLLVLGCDCEQVDALPGSVQYSAIEAHHVNGLGSKGVVGTLYCVAVNSFFQPRVWCYLLQMEVITSLACRRRSCCLWDRHHSRRWLAYSGRSCCHVDRPFRPPKRYARYDRASTNCCRRSHNLLRVPKPLSRLFMFLMLVCYHSVLHDS